MVPTSRFRTGHKIIVPRDVAFFYSANQSSTKFVFGADRGEVQIVIPQSFVVAVEGRIISLSCPSIREYASFRTAVGAIYRALLGVTRGYNQKLKTVGVGYKGSLASSGLLNMTLGYSHPVFIHWIHRYMFSLAENITALI
jgi:ribosomal protein L6P/L9E